MNVKARVSQSRATHSVCSLSLWERGGVRGYALSIEPAPLTPTLSPLGRGSALDLWHEVRS
jgi:hypothetical protein